LAFELLFAAPDVCQLPASVGDCYDNDVEVERWSYNAGKGACEKLMYTGCGGNLNNFANEKICEQYCGAQKREDTAGKSQPQNYIKLKKSKNESSLPSRPLQRSFEVTYSISF
jgi:hypothetical protein